MVIKGGRKDKMGIKGGRKDKKVKNPCNSRTSYGKGRPVVVGHNWSRTSKSVTVHVIANRILHEICLLICKLAIRGTNLTLMLTLGLKVTNRQKL